MAEVRRIAIDGTESLYGSRIDMIAARQGRAVHIVPTPSRRIDIAHPCRPLQRQL
jgi:hypothetical protein